MRYFDNQYLAQYLQQQRSLMVFVDNDYLEVSDLADLEDPINGVGYTPEGTSRNFNYKDIQVVKSGPYYLDLSTLNKEMDNIENPDAASGQDSEKKPSKPKADKPDKATGPSAADDTAIDSLPKPDEKLKESKFDRKSHSIDEKVDYWPTIKPKREISMVTNSLAKITRGEYKGMVGIITESSEIHKVIRATNKGDNWTWGSTVEVVPDDISINK